MDGGGDSKDDNDDLLAVLDIDAAEMEKTIAQNWGFIFNKGVFSLVGGTLALLVPTYASEVAYNVVTYTTAILAYFGVLGLFVAEAGFKFPSLLVGILNGILAYR